VNWFVDHLAVAVSVVLTLLAAVLILQQRRTPQSTAAWLLFIILVPYLALPLFIALGFRKTGSRYPAIRFSADETDIAKRDANELEAVFSRFGVPPATVGNRFALCADGTTGFASMMDVVESATASLDITFYLIADDSVGTRFVETLERKVREGVSVHLILDRLGDLSRPRAALERLTKAGGEVRYFSPVVHAPDKGHLNLRNHRKMVIADRRRVFSGGMNVGHEYMGPVPDPARWSDLSFTIEGPIVRVFCDTHDSDWQTMGGTPSGRGRAPFVPDPDGAIAQLVPSGPDRRNDDLHDGLVFAIHNARRRVWIATPYFLPTEFLGQALETAARRGVDVRIVLPEKSNHRIADFARGAYLRELSRTGCRILQFTRGMLHAKAGVIDDVAYVGSANFDVRSMLLNFEASMFVYDRPSVEAIAEWYAAQEVFSVEKTPPGGMPRRLMEGIFRLGSPVL